MKRRSSPLHSMSGICARRFPWRRDPLANMRAYDAGLIASIVHAYDGI
jgi:hypothetical protein